MPRRTQKPFPVEFPPVLDLPADPGWDLGTLAQYTVLLHFRQMLKRRQEVLDNTDIEGVHKIRVAARRTRTALQTFASLWDAAQVKHFQGSLADFASSFNVARDLDVMVVYLNERMANAQGKRATAYEFLLARGSDQRAAEQPGLVQSVADLDADGFPDSFIDYFSHTPYNLWEMEARDG